jgi:hypothetical protein
MNLAERLNQTSSKAVVQEVVDFIGSDTIKFDELMQLFFGKNERIVKKPLGLWGIVFINTPY